MKKLFYITILFFLLFEIAKVYFIMPLPGSQEINSIDTAYFLHHFAIYFRIIFSVLILIALYFIFKKRISILPIITLIFFAGFYYFIKETMMADTMFLQMKNVNFYLQDKNTVELKRLILGININGQQKAYPIQFLTYHHQVVDKIGADNIIVTYCNVCRTGRVYSSVVNGSEEKFRLVGMDHFNAMFEDNSTKSWWRQANGEAIAGKRKGQKLTEIPSSQMSLKKWLDLYPNTKILQGDTNFIESYDSLAIYEQGKSKGELTKTDTISWQKKSWILGIKLESFYKAYDWNEFKKYRIIKDKIGDKFFVAILSLDKTSFQAFEIDIKDSIKLVNDDIFINNTRYLFNGQSSDKSKKDLVKVKAYQEFWHSWKTFAKP